MDCIEIAGISEKRCNIRHSRIHVERSYGMSDGFCLLCNRQVILAVAAVQCMSCRIASQIEEELCKAQIRSVVRREVEFHQSRFDNLMSGRCCQFAGAEMSDEQICVLERNIQEILLAGCLVVCNGCFEQMTAVVELMTASFILPPGCRRTYPSRRWFLSVDRKPCSNVADGFLSDLDDHNDRIKVSVQFRIRAADERIRSAFDDLVQVGVVEGHFPFVGTFLLSARHKKIVNASFFVTFIKCIANRGVLNQPYFRQPEVVPKHYILNAHRADLVLRSDRRLLGKDHRRENTQADECSFHFSETFFPSSLMPGR